MKHIRTILNLVIIFSIVVPVGAIGQAAANPIPQAEMQPSSVPSPDYAPDRVIVKFRSALQIMGQGSGQSSLNALMVAYGVRETRQLFNVVSVSSELSQIHILQVLPGSDLESFIKALSDDPNVDWAEPDYLAYPAATTPNDPKFPDQWGLTQIEAPEAWDLTTGAATVSIAIIDSGIEFTHPDLSGQIWINPGEIAGNGIDDDNNGHVDDIHGWDFVNSDNDPSDDHGHGTQVAGIAAAATNNSLGIAGVCWNCTIMPVKVMQASGVANYSDIAAGVIYAAKKGAKVINISLGGYSDSSTLQAAIQTAVNTYGAVVVAGAGNDNLETPFYPAAYDEVLAVGGTDRTDAKAGLSNYGAWVDVSAPALDITTTFLGGDYGPVNGTSFASPFVAGLAGLLRSQNSDWDEALVRAQIGHTADDIDSLNPGFEGLLGTGRVNAETAVTIAPHPILEIASTGSNGDEQGKPTPGESATLEITIHNDWLDATSVSGSLSTTDPHVTITQGAGSFGDLLAGESAANTPDYAFDVALAAGYNHDIPFTLQVTANNGAYTVDLDFIITTRSADEPVGGTITTNTTWTNDKTYIVNGNLGVAPGVTLTIQAGTEVHFAGNYDFNVGGTLIADGTSAQPIWFMHYTGGSWGRILFDDSSVDAVASEIGVYQSGNILRWVRIEGATNGIGCHNATPYLMYVRSDGGGVSCTTGSTPLWFFHSEIQGNISVSLGADAPNPDGSWKDRTNMPTARGNLGVATAANGKIYAMGGENGDYPTPALNTVEEYDPATDIWTTKTSLPTARTGLAVVAASNGKVYAIGGRAARGGGVFLGTVEEYDPATDTWATKTSMPTPRAYMRAAEVDGKIYVVGGYDGNALAVVEAYDPAINAWTIETSMPTARHSLGIAPSNGKVYAIGGVGNQQYSKVEAYDPNADTWSARLNIPTSSSNIGAATAGNGKIYAFGGGLAETHEYDPLTNNWDTCCSSPNILHSHYLGVTYANNGKIYAIGGGDDGFSFYDRVVEFTLPYELPIVNFYNVDILNGSVSLPELSEVINSSIDGNISLGNQSTVKNTEANGTITLNGSGYAEKNTIINGGISIGSGEVMSNTITGGGITVGDGSIVQGNSIENASSWGINATGTVTFTKNRVVGGAMGVKVSGGLVQGNLIANTDGTGLEIRGDVTVISNTLTGNAGSAIRVVSGATLEIKSNNLEGNTGQYDIENLIPKATLFSIPAQNNWWGTTSNAEIAQRIFDFNDDYNLGQVLYAPATANPVQTAPAYVRSVTMSPGSPVGIETINFEIEFNHAMSHNITPILNFQSSKSGTWQTYTSENSGLPTDFINDMAIDHDSVKWFGADGVIRYDDTDWTIFNESNSPLPGNSVYAVTIDDNGDKWFGTDLGLARYNDSVWTIFDDATTGIEHFSYIHNVASRDGIIWVSLNEDPGNYQVAKFDGTTWAVFNASNSGFPNEDIGGIAIDQDGSVWFIVQVGVVHFDGQNWQRYDTNNSALLSNNVHAVAVDQTGTKWFGTDAGVASLSGSTWKAYNFSFLGIEESDGIASIAFDEQNTKWFGARLYDGGVHKIITMHPDGFFQTYHLPHQQGPGSSSNVGTVVIDQLHNKWLNLSGEGLAVLVGGSIYPIIEDGQWQDQRTYRAVFNITSLIPRGDYVVSVASAVGTDGIEIAPVSGYTFTVDYAGGIGDTKPPNAPAVTACSGTAMDTLSAQWSATDPESSIDLYTYAIGTTLGGSDVVNWTNTTDTSFNRSGLNLINDQPYFVSVKARNEGGLWSTAAVPDAVYAGSGVCSTTTMFVYLPLAIR